MHETERDRRGRYRRRPELLWRRTVDRAVLLVPGEGDVVELADTGAILWDALACPGTLAEVVTALADVFGMDEDAIRSDVVPVVDELVARGVLVREP